MPNCFGGDQFHPAYDCREADRIKGDPRKVLCGNTIYTIAGEPGNLAITEETIDGTVQVWDSADYLPDPVREAVAKLTESK